MEEVWIVIKVDISGWIILVIICEDGLLPVFAQGMRKACLERAMAAI